MYELVRIKKCLTKPAKSFIFTHIARALDHLVKCPFYLFIDTDGKWEYCGTKAFHLQLAEKRFFDFTFRISSLCPEPGIPGGKIFRFSGGKRLYERTD